MWLSETSAAPRRKAATFLIGRTRLSPVSVRRLRLVERGHPLSVSCSLSIEALRLVAVIPGPARRRPCSNPAATEPDPSPSALSNLTAPERIALVSPSPASCSLRLLSFHGAVRFHASAFYVAETLRTFVLSK
ncbi:hypothetical protein EYF80_036816 [Liparis tanakae]|uniref:Uncharacterized protein n=1 Tax=Liparis tanakae TaxID=230148 RepID=A0A4Z2GIC7_9TELE|nr:hypothetical protein EYF80_036816 [Liparis tanakae]